MADRDDEDRPDTAALPDELISTIPVGYGKRIDKSVGFAAEHTA